MIYDMNSIETYLSNITAEDQLKEHTKNFVKTALTNDTKQKNNVTSLPRKPSTKKVLAMMASAAACLLLLVGSYLYYNTPVNYVSIDINPSIELGINSFDVVVCAESFNEDGALLLSNCAVTRKPASEAISNVISEAVRQGFIIDDGSTIIALTAESNNVDDAASLQQSGKSDISSALSACGTSAIVYSDASGLQLRTAAKETGLSPGKYRLISILQALDSSITYDQFRNTRITDIITIIDDLSSDTQINGLQNEEMVRTINRIKETATQIHAAIQTQQNNQNQQGSQTMNNQNSSQNQYQEQAENQTQSQATGSNGSGQNNTASSATPQEQQEQIQNQNQNIGPSSAPEQEQEQNQNANSSPGFGQEQNQSQGNSAPADTDGQSSGSQGSSANSTGSSSEESGKNTGNSSKNG